MGPPPAPNNRRTYSIEDIETLRAELDSSGKSARRYTPRRRDADTLQVISVMNFKGGSGKTTTAAHLAGVSGVPRLSGSCHRSRSQASLSTLFGHQPELDVGENETLYGAIRYGAERRPMPEIVRGTYISDAHLVPGQLELMEFEHETPKALMLRQGSDTLFFSRIGEALAQVGDAYDVVVIDCPPQLGFLTLSALCAATAVLITVHPQMLDVMSMSQVL